MSSPLLSVVALCCFLLATSAFAVSDMAHSHTPLAASQEMKTVIEWSRQLRTCDEAGDRDIPLSGTSRIIYALGDEDPKDDTHVRQHSQMGVKNVNLLDSPSTTALPSDAYNLTLMSRPFPISPDSDQKPGTYYHCQGFAANFSQKAHVVRITPQIDYAHSALVHHMLLFKCPMPFTQAELDWAGNCYTQSTPRAVSACDQVSVIGGWAVGGDEFIYPPEVGFPMGDEESGTTYMMLQIHYHNPGHLSFNDSAGFALHFTNQLRKYDAGTFYIHQNLPSIAIPPKQEAYEIGVYCPDSCLQFPEDGVRVFASMLHTHETGVALWTEQFRNGTQLSNIDENFAYDFNFQQVVTFAPDAYPVLKKGDNLKLTCRYMTLQRVNYTVGGIATTDEMCMDYLWHYPALPLDVCTGIAAFDRTGGGRMAPGEGNYTASCSIGRNRTNVINFAAPAVDLPLPEYPCTAATLGNRTFNGDGTATTKAITTQQWMADRASYTRSIVLDEQGDVILYWNVSLDADGRNGVIRFAAEVATAGWFGIGLSASGAMIDADSVIGWVQTQAEGAAQVTVDLTDRYNDGYKQPTIDRSQDVFDVVGVQDMMDAVIPRPNPIYYNFTAGVAPCHHCKPDQSTTSSSSSSSSTGGSGGGSAGGSHSEMSTGALVGIAAGVVGGIVLLLVLCLVCRLSLTGGFRRDSAASRQEDVGLCGLNDDSLLGSSSSTADRRRNRDELRHGLLADRSTSV